MYLADGFDPRREEHRQDVDAKRKVDVEEKDSFFAREDERPSPTPCKLDVVDNRHDESEDTLVHPEVCEHRVLIAAKEVLDDVVTPPTTRTSFRLVNVLLLFTCLPRHCLSGVDRAEEACASLVGGCPLLFVEIDSLLLSWRKTSTADTNSQLLLPLPSLGSLPPKEWLCEFIFAQLILRLSPIVSPVCLFLSTIFFWLFRSARLIVRMILTDKWDHDDLTGHLENGINKTIKTAVETIKNNVTAKGCGLSNKFLLGL